MNEALARQLLDPLEEADRLIGGAAGVAADWAGASVGCVVTKGDARELLPEESVARLAYDFLPVPAGLASESDRLEFREEPPTLPAAPLIVSGRSAWRARGDLDIRIRLAPSAAAAAASGAGVHASVEAGARDDGDGDRTDGDELLDELTELFLEAYRGEGIGALHGASLIRGGEGANERILQLRGWIPPDEGLARGHLHWWLEVLARFLPVEEVQIVGVRERKGLRPSWLGPALVVAAALAVRWLDASSALYASALVWLFGPLMVTFLSRAHVGRVTWVVTALNAFAQALIALSLVRPDLWVPSPIRADTESLIRWSYQVRELLQWLTYGSTAIGLLWALVYVSNRHKRLQ